MAGKIIENILYARKRLRKKGAIQSKYGFVNTGALKKICRALNWTDMCYEKPDPYLFLEIHWKRCIFIPNNSFVLTGIKFGTRIPVFVLGNLKIKHDD